MSSKTKRSQQEIADRLAKVTGEDIFGFKSEVLLVYLDYDHAKNYLVEGVTPAQWEEATSSVSDAAADGAEYFQFAVAKCEDERGISANRSVMKLAEWAWLDGQGDLARDMDDDNNYGWYGRTALEMYAAHYGLPWDRGEH